MIKFHWFVFLFAVLWYEVLSVFQTGKEQKDKVLLLSLESSATGINLTCANHCILVHPMFGQNATDFEKQAIARVRRQGQTKTCYVYRCVCSSFDMKTMKHVFEFQYDY